MMALTAHAWLSRAWCNGGTLRAALHQGALRAPPLAAPLAPALAMLRGVAAGVAAMHASGVPLPASLLDCVFLQVCCLSCHFCRAACLSDAQAVRHQLTVRAAYAHVCLALCYVLSSKLTCSFSEIAMRPDHFSQVHAPRERRRRRPCCREGGAAPQRMRRGSPSGAV